MAGAPPEAATGEQETKFVTNAFIYSGDYNASYSGDTHELTMLPQQQMKGQTSLSGEWHHELTEPRQFVSQKELELYQQVGQRGGQGVGQRVGQGVREGWAGGGGGS